MILAPSLEIAARDGVALLFAGGGATISPSRPLNVGLALSFVQGESPLDTDARDRLQQRAGADKAAALEECFKHCSGNIAAIDKPFCDTFAKDPEKDALLEALRKLKNRQIEETWKIAAKRTIERSPEDDQKLLLRIRDFIASLDVASSGRMASAEMPEASEDLNAWEELVKQRLPPNGASKPVKAPPKQTKPAAAAPTSPTVDDKELAIEVKGVDAALSLIAGSIRRAPDLSPRSVMREELCPSGRANAEEADARRQYPGWWQDSFIVSFGVRATSQSFSFYTVEDGEALSKQDKRIGSALAALSVGKLIPMNERTSLVFEAAAGGGRGVLTSSKELKWCQSAGTILVDSTSVPAETCSTGTLGGPTPFGRAFATVLFGGVWARDGNVKVQLGGALEYRASGWDPTLKALDLSLVAPISINFGSKSWQERFNYNGALRLVPTVRWTLRPEPTNGTLRGGEIPAFLLVLQFLGRRSFWGDALSWL